MHCRDPTAREALVGLAAMVGGSLPKRGRSVVADAGDELRTTLTIVAASSRCWP
jgi:hypothetical protein